MPPGELARSAAERSARASRASSGEIVEVVGGDGRRGGRDDVRGESAVERAGERARRLGGDGELADVVESASGGFRLGASAGTRTRAAIAEGDAQDLVVERRALRGGEHGSHVATTAWHLLAGSKPDHANAGSSDCRRRGERGQGTLDGGRRGLAGATRGTPRGVILVVPKRHPTNQRQGVQHVAGRPRLAQRDRGGAVKRSHRIGTRTRGAHRAVCATDDARGVSAHEPSATKARGARK